MKIDLDQLGKSMVSLGTSSASLQNNLVGLRTELGNTSAIGNFTTALSRLGPLMLSITGQSIQMSKSLNTLKGVSIGNKLSEEFREIWRASNETTQGIESSFKKIGPAIQNSFKNIGPAIQNSFKNIGNSVRDIGPMIAEKTTAIKASGGAMTLLQTKTTALGNAMQLLGTKTVALKKKLTLKKVVTGLLSGVKLALSGVIFLVKGAMKLLTTVIKKNPIGLLLVAIAALVPLIGNWIGSLRRTCEYSERLKAETEALEEAIESQRGAMASAEATFNNNIRAIEGNRRANRQLLDSVIDLASEENKSVAQRRLLKEQIDQLSAALGGTTLYYDKESGALNLSNRELQNRIELLAAQESKMAGQLRQAEILAEIIEVEMMKEDTNALRERAIELYGEESARVRELDEIYADLGMTLDETQYLYERTATQVAEHTEAMNQAVREGTWSQIVSWDNLSEAQQHSVEGLIETYNWLSDSARDALTRMSTDAGTTMEEMIDTLNHNAEQTELWGENLALIYNRTGEKAVDEGFMAWVETTSY